MLHRSVSRGGRAIADKETGNESKEVENEVENCADLLIELEECGETGLKVRKRYLIFICFL